MFQHEMEKKLNVLKGAKSLIDDIFIWGDTQQEHDDNLEACLSRLSEEGITCSPGKCEFNTQSMEFFGIQFTSEGMQITPEKLKALFSRYSPNKI